MRILLHVVGACLAIMVLAAGPADDAVIIGTQPNDTEIYRITVSPDGSASMVYGGSFPQEFTVPLDLARRLFEALAVSQSEGWTSEHCAKQAPFLATVRVRWHDWVSSDVECPPRNVTQSFIALNHAVAKILIEAGPPASVPRNQVP